MADIQCPAPDCDAKWPSTTPQPILLKLLEIHERTAHPSSFPTTTSTIAGAKAEKVSPIKKCHSMRQTRFIEAKESGKRSASRTKPPSSASLDASSTYRQAEKRRLQSHQPGRQAHVTPFQPHWFDSKDKVTLCGHCGKAGHGRRRQERMNHCPAFNHTCSKCNLPHHFESVCRKSRPARNQVTTKQDDDATAVFEALCYIESDLPTQADMVSTITLEHHIYNSLCDAWQKRSFDPQPIVNVSVQALTADAADLGLQSTADRATNKIKIQAVADTGCQSCLAGTSLLNRIGMNISQLIPTSMKMKAANQNSIEILVALVLRITGYTDSGHPQTTRQIVYITD
ncbi:hypothetical protein ElyMa_004730200 [Elysia marginata]|uniref:Peptidase aspartic putative domain-containing protein n=1 Tax=Elysia marginata TaxID=1093978 RepID=A0AAV4IDI8_9GAST|nr:hypothetical protein ElyMa_004730200 [Elysia marginata]